MRFVRFISFFLLVIFLIPTVFSHAQTATDIQSKIDQNNQNIQSLEQEIAGYQGQLDSIGQQKSSLASSIKQLDLTKKKLNADIAVTQNKIDKTNLTIQNLSSDIVSKESSIQNNIRSIAVGLKNVNELEQTNMLQNIFSQDNFTVVLNDINNISTLRQTIRTDIDTLKQVKGTLEDTRKTTIDAKNQLLHLKSQLSDQQKIIAQNTLEKNNLLTQTKNSEANYQKLLKDRIAKRDIFEKEINDYEMQLQYVLDPSKLPQGRVLSWPMDKIYVTQLFGKTVAAKRLYTSGSHSGVDFRASVGTPVLSMADGVVAGTGNTDLTCYGGSFGKFVFIQYNNGLSSAYGHLSLIKAVEGQTVKRGDVVGYSGNTGHTTGPHLHVSLYAPGAAKMSTLPSAGCTGRKYTLPLAPIAGYLNVLDFLPPYTINTTILNNQTAE